MKYQQPRHAAVPWLLTDTDLRPCGRPDASEAPGAITLRLFIPHPFGRATDAVLTLRADLQTGVLYAGECDPAPTDEPEAAPEQTPTTKRVDDEPGD